MPAVDPEDLLLQFVYTVNKGVYIQLEQVRTPELQVFLFTNKQQTNKLFPVGLFTNTSNFNKSTLILAKRIKTKTKKHREQRRCPDSSAAESSPKQTGF